MGVGVGVGVGGWEGGGRRGKNHKASSIILKAVFKTLQARAFYNIEKNLCLKTHLLRAIIATV